MSTAPTMPLGRLPRYRRTDGGMEVRITPARHEILRALGRYDYLVARQINWVIGRSSTSLTSTQEHLKNLFHSGYVQRLWLPSVQPFGSSMAIYCLGNQGYSYLAQLRMAPEGRFRASELARREFGFLKHHLQANELLVLAERLAQRYQEVNLGAIKTDRHLRREPVYIGSGDQRTAVIPDGWVDLRLGSVQQCVAFELDRDTEHRKKIEAKVSQLVVFSGAPYQEAFGTASLTIAWVATEGGKGRVEALVRWIEAVLTSEHKEHEADLFRVASFDPAQVDPAQAYFGPIWRRPFDERWVTLIGGPDGSA